MNDITWGGVLTTAGDVVFSGGKEGYFFALDARTGELLWKASVGGQVNAGPMSYSVGGRQYVAVPVGGGAASWGTTIPIELSPEIKRPSSGNALFVFALPERAAVK